VAKVGTSKAGGKINQQAVVHSWLAVDTHSNNNNNNNNNKKALKTSFVLLILKKKIQEGAFSFQAVEFRN
jgi:hypothetical protein